MRSPVKAGDVIADKYEVERVLGVGGMGVVVAAKHVQLGERVAIKFLLPEALSVAGVMARFLREGRAAAKLKSEHVARVFDVGTLDGKMPYIVMEHLEGKDLGATLRASGKMPIETAVGYVLQACEGIAEAHGLGIVHRDLKPSNLFLTTAPDGSALIKVIDFGISKMVDESSDGGEMTTTSVMMGSPLYMAPEQMASARDADARSDVWSMGVILFALTTGRLPFKAPSTVEIFELVLKGAPSARALNPAVPEELDAAIHRCLQRPREARFQTIVDLALAIAPFASEEAQLTAHRFRRMSRSSQTSAASLAAKETPVSQPGNEGLASPRDPAAAAAATPGKFTPVPHSDSPLVSSHVSSNIPQTVVPLADGEPTENTWDKNRDPARKQARNRMLSLGVGAIAVLAVGLAFGRYSSSSSQHTEALGTATPAPVPLASAPDTTPQSSASATTPIVAPAVSASGSPADDTSSSNVSGAKKAGPRSLPLPSRQMPPPAKATAAPVAPKPKADLFSEPL